ncbi:MAG: hypothetical protein MUP66_01970, partial [Candidatus Nanohaloarchaeota archaeon QJJ-5]|nr:hypothetical protein [Candidatus Nanohaloarchaeota archaeon QJJ-5]
MQDILDDIFRAYDVRGKDDQLTDEVMRSIGHAFGTYVDEHGDDRIVVGHDARMNSESLYEALIEGIKASPIETIEQAGNEPFGVVQYHGWANGSEIAYITASHLSKEWNGVKFYHQTGVGYAEEENMAIKDMIVDDRCVDEGETTVTTVDAHDAYIDFLNDTIDDIDLDI